MDTTIETTDYHKESDSEVVKSSIDRDNQFSIAGYDAGIEAFEKSRKYHLQSAVNVIIDDSMFYLFFKSGQLEEIITLAISNLNDPKAHFYLDLVSEECRGHQIKKNIKNQNSEPPLLDKSLSLSKEEIDFLQGVQSSSELFESEKEALCKTIEDSLQLNQSQIEQAQRKLFDAKTYKEAYEQLDSFDKIQEFLTKKTGIAINQKFVRANQLVYKLSKSNNINDSLIESAKLLVEITKEIPYIYVTQSLCPTQKCEKLLGKTEYLNYITSGAIYGEEATLFELRKILKKQQQYDTLLSWNLYSRGLLEEGCVYGPDMLEQRIKNQKEYLHLKSKLSEDQIKAARDRSNELKENHLADAKRLLNC